LIRFYRCAVDADEANILVTLTLRGLMDRRDASIVEYYRILGLKGYVEGGTASTALSVVPSV